MAHQHLDNAELAYVSACLTALGGVPLLDEAINLAAALQLAGYRHVIATLWLVKDHIAPTVAEAVYRQLTDSGEPDADRAAYALHNAVATLRVAHPTDPTIWTPYLHVGP